MTHANISRRPRYGRSLQYLIVAVCAALIPTTSTFGQDVKAKLQINANQFARELFTNEVASQRRDHTLWSYLELKQDDGPEKLLSVCQARDGEIDRLTAVNGKDLTDQQRQAEDRRIAKMLKDPETLRRKAQKRHEDGEQSENLMEEFPDAFNFQYDGQQGELIRLKFAPNAKFHPSGHAAQVFHHMEGTILADPRQKRLAEMNGRLTSEVKFAGGLFGHLAKGGTFSVRQQDMGGGLWELTDLTVQMDGKALFFKTITVRQKERYTNFRKVPDDMTLASAAELAKRAAEARNRSGASGNSLNASAASRGKQR